VDVDAFTAAHQADWARLDELVRRRRRLTGDEVDELVTLYQLTTTHLSVLRASGHDPVLAARLSSRVAQARTTVTGSHVPAWSAVSRFAAVSFPAMAYRVRWWWAGTAGGSILVGVLLGWWVARSPGVQAAKRAMERAFGREVLFTREGGSGPEADLAEILDAPLVFVAVGLDQDRIHAPNEKVEMALLLRGAEAVAYLWADLAADHAGITAAR